MLLEAVGSLGFRLAEGPRWSGPEDATSFDRNAGMTGYARGEAQVIAALASEHVRIELWLWYRLGPPAYVGARERIDHDELMKRAGAKPAYPPFSPDPPDGFRALAADLTAARTVLESK